MEEEKSRQNVFILKKREIIKKILSTYLFFTLTLSAIQIEFKDVISQTIPIKKSSKVYYQLQADSYIERFLKKNRIKFLLNIKAYMLKNNYYNNGTFQSQKVSLSFKKAYVLFGKVYLFDTNGTIDTSKVISKEIIFDGHRDYILKKCKIEKNNYIYRRNKFKLIVKTTSF